MTKNEIIENLMFCIGGTGILHESIKDDNLSILLEDMEKRLCIIVKAALPKDD